MGGGKKGERRGDGKGPQFEKNDPPPVIRWLVTGLLSVLSGYTRPEFQHDDDVSQLTQQDLMREVCVKLSETDTMWILDMPSICLTSDSDEALEIARRNKRYEEVT